MSKLTEFKDWGDITPEDLPTIIYGGKSASHNDVFDSRNKFVYLTKCYDLPPVFKIKSLDGQFEIDRCFPLFYRPATKLEIERITNPHCNV